MGIWRRCRWINKESEIQYFKDTSTQDYNSRIFMAFRREKVDHPSMTLNELI